MGNNCYNHITKNELLELTWLVLEIWKDYLTINITNKSQYHSFRALSPSALNTSFYYILFLKWLFFQNLKLTDAEKFNICSFLICRGQEGKLSWRRSHNIIIFFCAPEALLCLHPRWNFLSCSDIRRIGVALIGHQRRIVSSLQTLRLHMMHIQEKGFHVWK